MKSSALCGDTSAPRLWAPAANETLRIKVLSYNLYWWKLFGKLKGVYKGTQNSAGRIVAGSMDPPYDVMGFQECEDAELVLRPVGLLKEYEVVQGTHAVCMAYRKTSWLLLEKGEADVAEDQATEYYGTRISQWMRLRYTRTNGTLLFVNHHGPLHVNSGGECGGVSTAHSLLNLVAERGKRGDVIVLVGDFNANAASLTIQELWKHLVLIHSGESFGGVDNIFSNIGLSSLISAGKVGSGGSDHDAIAATLELGRSAAVGSSQGNAVSPAASSPAVKAVRHSIDSQCGLLEPGVEYLFEDSAWSHHIDGSPDPRRCCVSCSAIVGCKAWVVADWVQSVSGPRCTLWGGKVKLTMRRSGVVSGLPPAEATRIAAHAAADAILEVA